MASSGTTLFGTLYYSANQTGPSGFGSYAPIYKQANGTLSIYKTLGSYTLFQGFVTRPNDDGSVGGGGSHIDVRLHPGATNEVRSPKAQVFSTTGRNLFANCGKVDLTQCP
jgi:hypothetical protein